MRKFKLFSSMALVAIMAVALIPANAFAASDDDLKGEVDGQTYTNSYVGITCTLPDDYTFYDEDQKKEAYSITEDIDDVKEYIDQGTPYPDMMAVTESKSSVNVNLGSTASIDDSMDEQAYLEASEETFKSTLESMGYTDVKIELNEECEFCGEIYPSLEITADVNGTTLYERVVAIICDDCVANITFGATDADSIDDTAACFEYCEE